jgi:CheY-like chemotaxis protein
MLAERTDKSCVASFMDCQMPKMDGYEATRTARLNESGLPSPVTPIADMIANAMNGDDKACFDAGMDDYTAKPIDADILFEKLANGLPATIRHL